MSDCNSVFGHICYCHRWTCSSWIFDRPTASKRLEKNPPSVKSTERGLRVWMLKFWSKLQTDAFNIVVVRGTYELSSHVDQHVALISFLLLHVKNPHTLGATLSSHSSCLCVLVMQSMGDVPLRNFLTP